MTPSIPQEIKACTKCGTEYPATPEFWHSNGEGGLRGDCKLCRQESVRRWQKANPEKVRETDRRYRKANPEKEREHHRLYREANPDKGRAQKHRRRARKRNAGGTWTAEDVRLMMVNQKGRCWYCQCDISEGYHIDHRIPLSRGGTNDPGNLVLACAPCNQSKHDKTPDEWTGRLL